MTPEERNLVIELFDRLATLEDAQRDPDAERLIRDGLRQAPNASYALVQTVLVQDEALKRADARIRELEGEPAADAPRDNSFLGGVRDSLFGRREGRGSVPSVPRPEDARGSMSPAWRTGTPAMAPGAGAGMPMGAGQPGGPMAGGPMAGGWRFVSGHRGGGSGRRGRRLAAPQRYSLDDGRPARRAGGVRSQRGHDRIIALGWQWQQQRRRSLAPGRARRHRTHTLIKWRQRRRPQLWRARRQHRQR